MRNPSRMPNEELANESRDSRTSQKSLLWESLSFMCGGLALLFSLLSGKSVQINAWWTPTDSTEALALELKRHCTSLSLPSSSYVCLYLYMCLLRSLLLISMPFVILVRKLYVVVKLPAPRHLANIKEPLFCWIKCPLYLSNIYITQLNMTQIVLL